MAAQDTVTRTIPLDSFISLFSSNIVSILSETYETDLHQIAKVIC